jgi:membrane protease YdiL (CAAX protease family)
MRVTAIISWTVIALLCVSMPILHELDKRDNPVAKTPASLPSTGTPNIAPPPAISLELRFSSRYAVGVKMITGAHDASFLGQLDAQSKSDTDRVAVAAVAGELEGADAARARLAKVDSADARAFERAYGEEPHALVDDVQKRYGFFADLAASHGKPDSDPTRAKAASAAKTAFYFTFVCGGLLIVGLLGGLSLLILGIVFFARGKLTWAFYPTARTQTAALAANMNPATIAPSPAPPMTPPVSPVAGEPAGAPGAPPPLPYYHGAPQISAKPPAREATYYVEAFAMYLVLLLGSQVALELLARGMPMLVKLGAMAGVVLFVAAWSRLRGGSWAQIRHDAGLHTGQGVMKEIGCGILGYLAGLPIIGLSLLVVLLLSALVHQTTTHPIVNAVDNTSVWVLLLLASVFAPITEELMFRGFFLAHLRRGMGVIAGAALSGLVFASVHPQGWLAIPALMTIGGWLAIIRQWRGSLIPSITVHAINNAVVVCIMMAALR